MIQLEFLALLSSFNLLYSRISTPGKGLQIRCPDTHKYKCDIKFHLIYLCTGRVGCALDYLSLLPR